MITKPWAFIVWGHAEPKGSMTCVGARGKIKHQLIEANKITSHKWRHKVAGVAAGIIEEKAAKYQAIALEITYSKARPNDHYGTGANANQLKATAPQYPTKRSGGDIDKLERNVLDALQEAGVLVDDAQVVDVHHHARFVVPTRDRALYGDALEKPGVLIRLEPMVEAPLIELPYLEVESDGSRSACLTSSNGQMCRYYVHADSTPHSFGGGMGDPIVAAHCPRNRGHEPHTWPPDFPQYACSGTQIASFCDDDQRIHMPHDNCPGRDHKQCHRTLAGGPHDAHPLEDSKRAWFCLGLPGG